MKVCPHCAEELPDEATVCPECHKDLAATPPSVTPQPPHEPEAWSFEDAREPTVASNDGDGRGDTNGRSHSDLDLGRLYGAAAQMLVAGLVFHRWYVPWNLLLDDDLAAVDEAFADPGADEDARAEAAMRRSEKLQAIGSQATFFSGVARIDGAFRSIRVAVTPDAFVQLDNWTHLDPDTELARLPRDTIADAVVVDENGNEVADALIDPIRELDTPEEERYAVMLRRHGPGGELPPVAFLFLSGEPALKCRDQYRRFLRPRA